MKNTPTILSFAAVFWAGCHPLSEKDAVTSWTIDTAEQWTASLESSEGLAVAEGSVAPAGKSAVVRSRLKTFATKRSATSLTVSQSPVWHNWQPVENLGPSNLGDAPVFLRRGENDYWMFGRYGQKGREGFVSVPAELEGFDAPLTTTPFPNQYDASGGLQPGLGGYHGWQSRDMVNWVHHGPISEEFSKWMTTAEYADGKAYFYYDFPNDQDPHLYIDDDLTDGLPGQNMGMAFQDPSHGSDCAFIRDLDGKFHVIYEDWSPIDASTHAWDSPLAGHAVSPDGIGGFEIVAPAVDQRTTPTGRFAKYPHPHWHAADPDNYPAEVATEDVPQHRIKKGQIRAFGEYEIHEPAQNAYGDWASIAIGGQYYLFGDFDPADGHGREDMSVAWFTSSSIDEPFTFCGNIGQGHPDPDIMFAEGQFYLVTQFATDFVSPGPWVDGVEVRVGVDTNQDGSADTWTDWQGVREHYEGIPGFAKQVAKTPAMLELADLPAGYGFQFEVRLTDPTDNISKPILDRVQLDFQP
ncbi:hypothetical protein N9Z12_02185 [Opitutaceae bacterium]|nr:hypothetical protein [Opitutaceae bacterium]